MAGELLGKVLKMGLDVVRGFGNGLKEGMKDNREAPKEEAQEAEGQEAEPSP